MQFIKNVFLILLELFIFVLGLSYKKSLIKVIVKFINKIFNYFFILINLTKYYFFLFNLNKIFIICIF
jgi:hypothetical protein